MKQVVYFHANHIYAMNYEQCAMEIYKINMPF